MLKTTLQLFRRLYAPMFSYFLLFGIINLAVFGPLVTFLLDQFIDASGDKAIGNFDIAGFLLTPAGLGFIVFSGVSFIIILVLEIAGIILIAETGLTEREFSLREIYNHLKRQFFSIAGIAIRAVVYFLAATIPFGILLFFIQSLLLAEHDINYYLAVHPPEFWTAVVVAVPFGIITVVAYIAVAIYFIFALPSLLFSNKTAAESLKSSFQDIKSAKIAVALTFIKLALIFSPIAFLVQTIIYFGGDFLIKISRSSLYLLLPAIGATLGLNLIAGAVLGFIILSFSAIFILLIWLHINGRQIEIPDERQPIAFHKRKMFLGVALATLAAGIFSVQLLLNTLEIEEHVVNIAHRAGAATAPENTLSAVKQCVQDGADVAEIDVQRTKDGVIVLWHDKDMMRIIGKPLEISKTDFANLRALDVGSWFSTKYANEPIAQLVEVVEAAKEGNIHLLVDLKSYDDDGTRLVHEVVALLKKHNFTGSSHVMSLQYDEIKTMKKDYPGIPSGFVASVALGDLTKLNADFLAVSQKLITDSMISTLHAQDKQVYAWTIDDAKTMSSLIDRGVDCIITNTPSTMVNVLKERETLTPSQRLLLRFGELYRW